MRRDFETANRVLPTIPKEHRTRVAHFLEKQGFKEQALQVSTDSDHRFDLALQIGDLNTAIQLAREMENPQKWSHLADVATKQNKFDLVKECLEKANDFGGLLLLATSSGNADMVRSLGQMGSEHGKHNISFLSMFLLGDLEKCLDILINTNRLPEAAFFARTYIPSKISHVVQLWRTELAKINEKAGQSLADPAQYENLFPGLHDVLKTEQFLSKQNRPLAAHRAQELQLNIERRALEEMHLAEERGTFDYDPSANGIHDVDDAIVNDEDIVPISDRVIAQQQSTSKTKEDAEPSTNLTKTGIESSPPGKRRISLDKFELEIEGIQLDDNEETSVSVYY